MLGFSAFVVAVQLLNSAQAADVTLMENFMPEKIDGTWHVWKRTGRLIDTTSKCVRATIHHENGDIYKVEADWVDDHGNKHADSFFVVDDRSQPARFMFQSDNHRVALSILGSNYKDYIVAFGMLGPKESYSVAFRQTPPSAALIAEVEEVLKKNNVALDTLIEMEQSTC